MFSLTASSVWLALEEVLYDAAPVLSWGIILSLGSPSCNKFHLLKTQLALIRNLPTVRLLLSPLQNDAEDILGLILECGWGGVRNTESDEKNRKLKKKIKSRARRQGFINVGYQTLRSTCGCYWLLLDTSHSLIWGINVAKQVFHIKSHQCVPLPEGFLLLWLPAQSQEHRGDSRRQAVTLGELDRTVEGP